jgi:hypothetical protein
MTAVTIAVRGVRGGDFTAGVTDLTRTSALRISHFPDPPHHSLER